MANGRFASFDNFTVPARAVLARAQAEATRLGHSYIVPLHLAVGLLHSGDSWTQRLLTLIRIDSASLRRELTRVVDVAAWGEVPSLAEATKSTLRQAILASMRRADQLVGVRHIWLGLDLVKDDAMRDAFAQAGAPWPTVRTALARSLVTVVPALAPRLGALAAVTSVGVTRRFDDLIIDVLSVERFAAGFTVQIRLSPTRPEPLDRDVMIPEMVAAWDNLGENYFAMGDDFPGSLWVNRENGEEWISLLFQPALNPAATELYLQLPAEWTGPSGDTDPDLQATRVRLFG